MWNDGRDLLWSHIITIAQDEAANGLKLIPKLTFEHVNLNPYSVMNVRLATQVLSSSVANILFDYYPRQTHATAKLCQNMNKFFDCLNVRNQTEGQTSRNSNLLPYRFSNDPRFDWLQNDFLGYLRSWKDSVEGRAGNFEASDRVRMFLSHQTYEGLIITVNAVIECTKFLLDSGMPFVLTEKFNQDVLEEYFGRHRSMGRRSDNPSLQQFGYQTNTIRIQRSIAPVTGNTRGRVKEKRHVSWNSVDDTPLPKKPQGGVLY